MKASILLVTLILAAAVVGLAVPASTTRGAASPKAEPAGGGRWETIYDEPGLALYAPGERDLVADADGNLHAVYGGSLLYYARKVDGVWQHELVDNSPMAGSGASLAVDAAGRPHICYLVGAYEPELRYRGATRAVGRRRRLPLAQLPRATARSVPGAITIPLSRIAPAMILSWLQGVWPGGAPKSLLRVRSPTAFPSCTRATPSQRGLKSPTSAAGCTTYTRTTRYGAARR